MSRVDAGHRALRVARRIKNAEEIAPGIGHTQPVTFVSGPEGGLSPAEEAVALGCGFVPVTLGTRVLRSETAALAALMALLV